MGLCEVCHRKFFFISDHPPMISPNELPRILPRIPPGVFNELDKKNTSKVLPRIELEIHSAIHFKISPMILPELSI